MRVLLTGGAGYIGAHTAALLLQAGVEVVIADDFSASAPAVIGRITAVARQAPSVYQVDVADTAGLQTVFDREQPDAVLHFAGRKSVAESVASPLAYYANNLGAILSLLQCMRRARVKRLIVSSSAAVYGTQDVSPLTERAAVGGCASPYGWSKFMLEQIVRDEAAARGDFSAVLLRYFNPAGAHPSGLLGEDGASGSLMTALVQTAAGQRPALQICGGDYPTADGTGVRDYLHVMDLARGHLAALHYSMAHSGVEAVNLGAGRGCSVLELVETFRRVNHVTVPVQMAARRPGDVAVCYADVARARALLGWEPRCSLAEICRDAWNWQVKNPAGYETQWKEQSNGGAVDDPGDRAY